MFTFCFEITLCNSSLGGTTPYFTSLTATWATFSIFLLSIFTKTSNKHQTDLWSFTLSIFLSLLWVKQQHFTIHSVKHLRIRFSLTRIFLYKDRSFHTGKVRVRERSYSVIFYAAIFVSLLEINGLYICSWLKVPSCKSTDNWLLKCLLQLFIILQ